MILYFEEIDPSKIVSTANGKALDYPYLDSYWTDAQRDAFWIYYGAEKIGFALINDWVLNKTFQAQKSIAEFSVKPEWRRKGYGKASVFQILKRFPTSWEIRQQLDNPTAILFWRSIIEEFTQGDYIETQKNNENILCFSSA